MGYSVFLWSADGYIRELLEFIKGVKYLFEAQEGRSYFSGDAAAERGLISRRGENLLGVL